MTTTYRRGFVIVDGWYVREHNMPRYNQLLAIDPKAAWLYYREVRVNPERFERVERIRADNLKRAQKFSRDVHAFGPYENLSEIED